MDFKAIDEKPVKFFFLIVAPPLEVSNQYLPVLGKIAQFSKEPDVPERLLDAQASRASSCSCSRRKESKAGSSELGAGAIATISTQLPGPSPLFPLDRRRRLRADVVHDAVHARALR